MGLIGKGRFAPPRFLMNMVFKDRKSIAFIAAFIIASAVLLLIPTGFERSIYVNAETLSDISSNTYGLPVIPFRSDRE